MCVCARAHSGYVTLKRYIPQEPPSLFFETHSLIDPEFADKIPGIAGQQAPESTCSELALEVSTASRDQLLKYKFGGSNSNLYSWKARTLSNVQSLQSCNDCFLNCIPSVLSELKKNKN